MSRLRRRAFLWLLFFTLGWLLTRPQAHAASPQYKVDPPTTERYNRPEDLLDLIPFLGQIPRSFLWGDGYAMKLSGTELRIDHMGTRSRAKAHKRDCMIGFSYVTPVAGFFTTRVDMPIFYAPSPELSQWSMNTLGDYVAYFSKDAAAAVTVRLAVSARF